MELCLYLKIVTEKEQGLRFKKYCHLLFPVDKNENGRMSVFLNYHSVVFPLANNSTVSRSVF